jgi:hypothetical protein
MNDEDSVVWSDADSSEWILVEDDAAGEASENTIMDALRLVSDTNFWTALNPMRCYYASVGSLPR